MLCEESLERTHDAAKVCFVLVVIVEVLSVQNVVHRHELIVLVCDARAVSAELLHGVLSAVLTKTDLHLTTDTEDKAEMHTERPHVGARLTAHPENAHLEGELKTAMKHLRLWIVFDELVLVDGSNAELALHSRDQRRTLEESARQLKPRFQFRARKAPSREPV